MAIVIGNIPEIILADFQLRGNTCGTVSAVRSGSFHTRISAANPPVAVLTDVRALTVSAVCTGSFHASVGLANPPVSVLTDVRGLAVSAVCTGSFHAGIEVADPPVAVVADVWCFTVLAFFAILTVDTFRFDFRIRKTNPPVAVLTDIRGIAILARLSINAGGLHSGICTADPPVAVTADIGCLVRAVIYLVGPDALILFVVYRLHGRYHIGVAAVRVKTLDFIFRRFGRQLFRHLCVVSVFILAVNVVTHDLRVTVFSVRLCPGKRQVECCIFAGNRPVQIINCFRRRGDIGNTVADKGRHISFRTAQMALPLPQRPVESVGAYNRCRNAVRHKALPVDAGNGTTGAHRRALGGGISFAVAVFQIGGDAVHCYVLVAPFHGTVEEKAVGHFHAFRGGVFLCPRYLIQCSVIAQSKLRFADSGGIDVCIQISPALVVVAVRVTLVSFQPVGCRINLCQ